MTRDARHEECLSLAITGHATDEEEVTVIREYDTSLPVDSLTGTPPLRRETTRARCATASGPRHRSGDHRQERLEQATTRETERLEAADLTTLQGVATYLQEHDRPLVIGYAPKITAVTALPSNLAGAGKCNVSVIIGQAGQGTAADLYADAGNTGNAGARASLLPRLDGTLYVDATTRGTRTRTVTCRVT